VEAPPTRHWPPAQESTDKKPCDLAHLVPLVIERKVFVDDSLANRLNPVEPHVALVARLETRGDVDRQRQVKSLRHICPAVVLHEDGRAVIGASDNSSGQ
jgi:hypothetical protein